MGYFPTKKYKPSHAKQFFPLCECVEAMYCTLILGLNPTGREEWVDFGWMILIST